MIFQKPKAFRKKRILDFAEYQSSVSTSQSFAFSKI